MLNNSAKLIAQSAFLISILSGCQQSSVVYEKLGGDQNLLNIDQAECRMRAQFLPPTPTQPQYPVYPQGYNATTTLHGNTAYTTINPTPGYQNQQFNQGMQNFTNAIYDSARVNSFVDICLQSKGWLKREIASSASGNFLKSSPSQIVPQDNIDDMKPSNKMHAKIKYDVNLMSLPTIDSQKKEVLISGDIVYPIRSSEKWHYVKIINGSMGYVADQWIE